MERRSALKNMGLAFGYAVATPTLLSLLQSCKDKPAFAEWTPSFLSKEHGYALAQTLDVILPKSELRAVYSQHTEAMYRMQSKNIWQAQSLASLRDTLLPKLLSGELSVSDAEYQMTEEELIPQEEIN